MPASNRNLNRAAMTFDLATTAALSGNHWTIQSQRLATRFGISFF